MHANTAAALDLQPSEWDDVPTLDLGPLASLGAHAVGLHAALRRIGAVAFVRGDVLCVEHAPDQLGAVLEMCEAFGYAGGGL